MDKDSRALTEIKGFTSAASTEGKSDKEIFQELFKRITTKKGLGGKTIRNVKDFNKKGEYIGRWRRMLSWDIVNFLVDWVEEINLTKKAQRIVISIIIGSEVMDEEDLEELAEVLDKKGLNTVIKKWIELQLVQAK